LILSLSLDEASFMLRGGNKLITVAQPKNIDREEVIYPIGYETGEDSPNKRTWLLEPGREYEPLKAGFGRYILQGDCSYLQVSEEGWEYCGVYEARPEVCRTFEMGAEKCQLLRALRLVEKTSTDPH
jgi:Fe-S-cluster containining protein